MSDIAEAVGKRIYAIRTSKHMSRKDLAKQLWASSYLYRSA